MSPRLTSPAPPFLRSSTVISWLAPTKERSTTSASPMTCSSMISAVVMPFLKTCSGESMWAPVCRLWFTLETCQKPGPRRWGVTSSFMLVEGGLKVFSSTVTDRSMKRLMRGSFREVGDGAGGPGQLHDVEPGVGPVRQVDEAAVVHVHVVGLDRGLAARRAARDLDAALVRLGSNRRNIEASRGRMERVAHVHRPHPRVEVRDERQAAVVDRAERLVARVGAEAPAAAAEVAGGIRHLEGGHRERGALGGDVHHERELADLLALVAERLGDQQHEVARAARHARRPVRHRDAQDREAGVPTPGRGHVEPADLGIEQVLGGRREAVGSLGIAREELLAVDDLEHALGPGAVREVDAVPQRDGPVHALRCGAGGAGLLPGQPEVADEARLRRIAQVVDLGHAVGAPAGRRAVRDQVGDAGVALPPVLVRALEAVEHRDEPGRLRGIGHVPDLVREVAERAQEIGLLLLRARQRLAVADPHHGRPARLRLALRAWDVMQVARVLRVRDVQDGRAVQLLLAGERVHPLATVVTDVGDPARALVVDDRLVGRAGLEVVRADQAHVALLLGRGGGCAREQTAQHERGAPAASRAHGVVSVDIDAPPWVTRCGMKAGPKPTRGSAGRSIANPGGHFAETAAKERAGARRGGYNRGMAANPTPTLRLINGIGNLLGAIVAFLYFRVVDNTATDSASRVGLHEIVYSIIVFAALVAIGQWYGSRWMAPVTRAGAGEPLSPSEAALARRRALIFPFFLAGLTFLGWVMAGLIYGLVMPLMMGRE